MKKIVICGNYGASNLGDEAILDGIVGFIRKIEPDTDITVMSAKPAQTAQLHGVKSVAFVPSGFRSLLFFWRGGLKVTMRAIKTADIFILGGGGLFTDEKFRAIIIWFLQSLLPIFFKKPFFCLGQSVGPLKTWLGRFLTKRVFKHADSISVRDQISGHLLHQIGIQKVSVLADPAFNLSLKKTPPLQREPYIILSIRPWLQKQANDQYRTLSLFIEWVYEKHRLKTVLVPFQLEQDDDGLEFQKIMNRLEHKAYAEIVPYDANYLQAIELIAGAKAVVGMRLHSLIFATLTQTPFLALAYSQKVTAFVKDLTLEDYCLEWQNLELEKLKNTFEILQKNASAVSIHLQEKKKTFRLLTQKNERLLEQLLSAPD